MAQPLPSHRPHYEARDTTGAPRPFEPWDPAMVDSDNPVAALQTVIYERFDALNRQVTVPPGNNDRLEMIVATASRVGGVVLFFAVLTGVVVAIL